ncbi:GAF domain-containing protein [Marinobacterium sp. D7]|uniref:GAF domain-containing protein n=1 Tax=Marinobacterium ramblicola TaxID=2849041 RepID=UPI001C2D0005|nr:GAF domain-containing protein [Marinobacterium ramblicola]MBV1790270.1 GAF domain-containing protein [Marinobacterium ramblicola]
MYSKKVSDVIDALVRINKLSQSGVIFWNTLLLPILIAVFVTYILELNKNPEGSVSKLIWFLVVIVTFIHLFVVYLQYRGSSIDTLLKEYQEKDKKLNEVARDFEELKSFYEMDVECFSSQQKAIRFAVNSLSYAIGKLRNLELESEKATVDEINEMVHSLIWPLVVYRENLFGFKAGVLWNIALYGLNADNELEPIWRKCDERIKPRNRTWKPGFGVAGMSFLHKSIKYYEDIKENAVNDDNTISDLETYRSIIAIPVIPCEDESSSDDFNPSGVLVITSSSESQFQLDRDADFLQIYANLLAVFLEKIQTYFEHSNNVQNVGGGDDE